MKPDILKADAHLAIGSVWANHSDSAEVFMLGGLDELKDFIISRDEHIAFFKFVFIWHIILVLSYYIETGRVEILFPFNCSKV
jgi:hypothetical protein